MTSPSLTTGHTAAHQRFHRSRRKIQGFVVLFVFSVLCSAAPDFAGRDGWRLYAMLAFLSLVAWFFVDSVFGSDDS